MTAVNRWRAYCIAHGWGNEVILTSGFRGRGGRIAGWVLSMADETDLVFSSIENYVWGMCVWQTLQRQFHPLMGVQGWSEFMQGISVITFAVGEPREEIPFAKFEAMMVDIYQNHWDSFEEVQYGFLFLVLLFSFSRSECPCPKTWEGKGSWDPKHHWQRQDFVLVPQDDGWVLYVRFKAIKQDPRMERPQARIADTGLPFSPGAAGESKDFVCIGDVPSVPHMSVKNFMVRMGVLLQQRIQRSRASDEPFFLSPGDLSKPLLYRHALDHLKTALVRAGSAEDSKYGFHGIRVLGYNRCRDGSGDTELTVAHGGWSETSNSHSRYARFPMVQRLSVSAFMLGVAPAFDPDATGADANVPSERAITAQPVPRGGVATAPPATPAPAPAPAVTSDAGPSSPALEAAIAAAVRGISPASAPAVAPDLGLSTPLPVAPAVVSPHVSPPTAPPAVRGLGALPTRARVRLDRAGRQGLPLCGQHVGPAPHHLCTLHQGHMGPCSTQQ